LQNVRVADALLSELNARREVSLSSRIGKKQSSIPGSCPLELAINTIGGRWKLHVLRELVIGGPQRYNTLLHSISGISPKELTRNLRELEAAGLLKHVEQDAASAYALTTLGREIEAPFRALGIFGSALADARDLRRVDDSELRRLGRR
jgi:DNA-binding HxlR family transcriptional regulator